MSTSQPSWCSLASMHQPGSERQWGTLWASSLHPTWISVIIASEHCGFCCQGTLPLATKGQRPLTISLTSFCFFPGNSGVLRKYTLTRYRYTLTKYNLASLGHWIYLRVANPLTGSWGLRNTFLYRPNQGTNIPLSQLSTLSALQWKAQGI